MASVNRATPAVVVPQYPLDRETLKGLLGEIVRDALASNDSDTTPSASILHDVAPESHLSAHRDTDLSDPATRFFSDVAKPSGKASKRVSPQPASGVAPKEDERVQEALQTLGKARQVLTFVNPDLKGKSRKWRVNSVARKRANETALQLVNAALRSLTR